jgi:lysophospholipase L1-like esterase
MPWAPVDIISSIDESYVNDFKELISLTESQNVKYIFVSHPLPAIKDLANNHNRLRPIIEEIAQKNGVIYLDYTHHPDFQNIENFADENHLNQAGVDRFNEMLIADLKKHNLLPQ